MSIIEQAIMRDHIERTAFMYMEDWLRKAFPDVTIGRDVAMLGRIRIELQESWRGHWYEKNNFNEGKSLTALIQHYFAVPEDRAAFELARRVNFNPSLEGRYLLSKKFGCSQIHAFPQDKYSGFNSALLLARGYTRASLYWYRTADGKSVSGNVAYAYPESGDGPIVKIPQTLWENEYGHRYIDALHFVAPYHLYNLGKLTKNPNAPVLICEDEAQVDWLERNHRWLMERCVLTTWSGGWSCSIAGTDWGLLHDRCVIILIPPSKDGFCIAESISQAVAKQEKNKIFYLLPALRLKTPNDSENHLALGSELTQAWYSDDFASRASFLEMAEGQFQLEFESRQTTALPLSDFMALPAGEPQWLIPDLIRAGDRVMIYGEPKSGKTWFALNICLKMATDGNQLLYFDGEMSTADFQFRCRSLLHNSSTPQTFRLASASVLGEPLDLSYEMVCKKWKKDISQSSVIVLDNLQSLFRESLEADPESSERLNTFVNTLALQGKTVILVHHCSRGGNPFGSSAKQFGLELTLRVMRKDKDVTITPENARNLSSEQSKSFKFQLPCSDNALKSIPVSPLAIESGAQNDEAEVGTPAIAPVPDVPEAELDDLDKKILAAHKENPDASGRDIAVIVGKSHSTVAGRISKLKEAGRMD